MDTPVVDKRLHRASAPLVLPDRYLRRVLRSIRRRAAALGVSLLLLALPTAGHSADAGAAVASSGERLELTARIIGGRPAGTGDWPSIVSLVSTEAHLSAELRHYCGATLIHPYWVLTAAHCTYDFSGNPLAPENIRVVAGVTDLRVVAPEDEYDIAQIVTHPGYDFDNLSSPNDIALLELATPAAATPVALYRADGAAGLEGLWGNIIGWGALRIDEQSGEPVDYSPLLQVAELPIVSNAVCNEPESYDGLIDDSQLCAGFRTGGVDACAGDSGGPLIIGVDGLQIQAGIVSFGRGCAEADFYGVYTRVSAFESWILGYVNAEFRARESTGGIRPPGHSSSGGGGAAVTLPIVLAMLLGGRWAIRRRRLSYDR